MAVLAMAILGRAAKMAGFDMTRFALSEPVSASV